MNEQQQQLSRAIGFLFDHLRLILFCLLIGMAAGLAWYLQKPKVYQASALLMYQQQQINPSRMSPDVQTRLQEMVNTVGQQVTSLSNLEEIIETNNLYPERRQRQPMVDVVAAMRGNISIQPQRDAAVFRVSFTGSEPRQVMLATNALAAKFVEENIRFREQRVSETLAYIRDELAIAKASLDKQEQGMRDYKLRYYNEMPEQRAANIARLNTLQTQYQNIQNNLQDLKRTQVLIQEQINLRQDILARIAEGQTGGAFPREAPPTELERIRQELQNLQDRYTDNHPDVRRLQNRLSALKAELAAIADPKDETVSDAPSAPLQPAHDTQLAQLELQLKEIEISAARLTREQEAVRQQIDLVQQWVDTTPVREAEWAALTRDYRQLQQHYENLVARSLEAESAELLEQRQRGSQFRIIESAHLPNQPFSPNFRKIMIMAAAAGLGMGLMLSYARDFMDSSFKNVQDLENFLGLSVTCTIPLLPTAREKRWARLGHVFWFIALGTGFALLGGGMVLFWLRGEIIL
ncbi:GumC family protein [Desulfurivibrio alkaliphilus]|uniref:Lipopolysaccharide biosynthesis protein n=1 Tax=Desulfurivibrio alkaliphilus (strain DSM 19089 / UNIQEM U267 / AHT2) TaxID=589865 RepID=D6Z4F6_DESAT|nr:Wzz/FepE/Etk N-terminal domain-containing protein [Desulfurivibrio alkaliphilus]ADH86431.1 lipopolysaccharide biosynthesis protein [Desulfurivibrio alkaliphilus AHT 2]